MRVLALDTTTRAGSVSVVDGGAILLERAGDPTRTHAERLPGEILSALREARVPLESVDIWAVAAGPGSFTGLRVGIATIQGLAIVQQRPVVPVSALEALAQSGSRGLTPGCHVAGWMDAHRKDVFSALYRVAEGAIFSRSRLIEVEPPLVDSPQATLERWRRHPPVDVFIGDGAARYAHTIGPSARVLDAPGLAGVIGLMAHDRAQAGELTSPAGIQPIYVRRPDAEIDRERRAAQAASSRDRGGVSVATRWTVEPLSSVEDIEAVLGIEQASFTNPWTRDMYTAELDNRGRSFLYLARDQNRRIVGFCSFWRVLDELHINNLAVLPDHRRKGVASELLTSILAEAQAMGAKRAMLEVRESNVEARRLYERFGFSISGIRPRYYTNPIEDALVLTLEYAAAG
jgi:tRNA threonylcarbamoyl adenosine modification protein YeaZ/ribosomal-protein-alanine acetyltransferase